MAGRAGRVARGCRTIAAPAITLALVAFVGYAGSQLDELRHEVPRLGQDQPVPAELDLAARDAIAYAQRVGAPPESNGHGKGYVLASRAPKGAGTAPGHWCADRPIAFRVDWSGAMAAGLGRHAELARWRQAFAAWARASSGRYSFRYAGQAVLRLVPEPGPGLPLAGADSLPEGIAITYGVGTSRPAGRWGGYTHPVLDGSLGYGGAAAVAWDGGPSAGLITHGLVVIDALDAALDPHAVPTVYVHEVGHALGLGHVGDPGQIMYPHARSANVIAAGDRAGVRRLASARC